MCSRSSLAARVARSALVRLLPVVGLALIGAASCSTQVSEDEDDLRALLYDDPVTQISQSALSSTGAGGNDGSGPATDAGTPVGTAGNSGAAGRSMMPTGIAGTSGTPMPAAPDGRHPRQGRLDGHRRKRWQ